MAKWIRLDDIRDTRLYSGEVTLWPALPIAQYSIENRIASSSPTSSTAAVRHSRHLHHVITREDNRINGRPEAWPGHPAKYDLFTIYVARLYSRLKHTMRIFKKEEEIREKMCVTLRYLNYFRSLRTSINLHICKE